ncbi:MAG: hypothetical protein IJY57_05025 [Clostridia bacterium]|nr:hypothetical protein [Clostridia bacterium]
MEYVTPTSHEELINTLRDIFVYYRIQKQDFYPEEMQKISLEKLPDINRSESELFELAKTLLSGAHEKEIFNYKQGIALEIENIEKSLQQLEETFEKKVSALNVSHANAIEEYKILASKNGIMNTDIFIEKVSTLKADFEMEISKLNSEKQLEIQELNSKKEELIIKKENAKSHFEMVHTAEVNSKTAELMELETQNHYDILRYNNSVDEKNIKYSNYVDQLRASLLLRYLEIRSEPLSKDELVNLGYYTDVIECIDAYYSTLTPTEAYEDMIGDPTIGMYLEDYYQIILMHYKTAANA